MGHVLILSEKPSQGAAYGEAFQHTKRKDGYIEVNDSRFFNGKKAIITWGFGHLVELVQPEKYNDAWKVWDMKTLPMIPQRFKYQVSSSGRKQYNIVKDLLGAECDSIIVGTDCDREGENIARSIIEMAGASHKPTKRLWINSLEVDEIQKGFQNLKEGDDYLPLYEEAQTRQFSDWLVGINASRAYTLLLQEKGLRTQGAYSVGRVQTPTLHLIYQRQQEIEKFVSKPFFEWFGNVSVKNGRFTAKYKERFETKEDATLALQKYGIDEGENQGFVSRIEKVQKKTKSPRLHSLSSLQGRANKLWKYSPADVLKIVQSLYEKKVVSYPRTDTHFITESEFAYLQTHLAEYQQAMNVDFEIAFPDPQKRFVDGSKVQEHYALIPTKKVADISSLNEKEKNIYQEILLTTLAMFAADYEFEETKVTVNVNNLLLDKTGKTETKKGWRSLFEGLDPADKKEKSEDEAVLPIMIEGEKCSVFLHQKEGKTHPPKPFTEGQLIQVMKNCGKDIEDEEAKDALKQSEGIGTEATRANIIETLKGQKYIEVKKNIVHVTDKGMVLCQAVEGTLLASPEMTGKWEHYLHTIGQGKGSQDAFLTNIEKFIRTLLAEAPNGVKKVEGQAEQMQQSSSVGSCPVCNEGNIQDRGKFYGCTGYSDGCTFTLPKAFCGKALSVTNIKKMLSGGKTPLIKGFKSKKGTSFDAFLKLENGKMKFEFKK